METRGLGSIVKVASLLVLTAAMQASADRPQHVIWERGSGNSSGLLSSERCRPLQRLVDAAMEAESLEEIPARVERECNSMRVGLFDVTPVGPPAKTSDITPVGPPAKTSDITPVGPPAKTADVTPVGPPALMRLVGTRAPGSAQRVVYPVVVPSRKSGKSSCPIRMEPEAPSSLSGVHIVWTDDEQKKWVKDSDFPWVSLKTDRDNIYIESANCHFNVEKKRR